MPHPLSRFEANLQREKVFKLIKDKSFFRGTITLASGKVSNYYLDMKPAMLDPHGANALSEMILDRLESLNVDYVGGLAMGAVPLISVISLRSTQRARQLPGFFVRAEVKDHGTRKKVEGLSPSETLNGKRVVILDDVTTTGSSAMIAVDAAQKEGAQVVLVLSVVDREEGAVAFYHERDIPFEALFTSSDFLKS